MGETRFRALLVGNAVFEKDPHNLPPLKGPPNDLKLLQEALTDPEVGVHAAGEVSVLLERTAHEIREGIEEFCSSAGPDDQLLFYYTGHGRQDLNNNLYLCGRDTRTDRLISSGVSDATINGMLQNSRASRFVIILDCCHSGSFKGGGVPEALKLGAGRFLLTSCRGQTLSQDAAEPGGCSAFTRLLVEGLLAAEADTNADHFVTLEEVYNYLLPKLVAATGQIPQRHFDRAVGDVPLGRARKKAAPSPPLLSEEKSRSSPPTDDAVAPLPPGRPILAVSETRIEFREVRLGEKLPTEIIDVFNEGDGRLDWTASTEEAWIQLEPGDGFFRVRLLPAEPGPHRGNIYVRDRGRGGAKKISVFLEIAEAVKKPLLQAAPLEIDFGTVRVGARVPPQIVRLSNRGGGELSVRARSSHPLLKLSADDEAVAIEPDTTREGALEGEVVVSSAGGEARVRVRGAVERGPILAVDPGKMIDFGRFPADQFARETIKISNTGSGKLEWRWETKDTFFTVVPVEGGLRLDVAGAPPGNYLGTLVIASNGGEATINVRARIEPVAPAAQPPLPPVAASANLSGWWMDQQMARIHITGTPPHHQWLLYNAFGAQVGAGRMSVQGDQAFFQGTAVFLPFTAQVQVQNPGTMSGSVTCLGNTGPLLLTRTG